MRLMSSRQVVKMCIRDRVSSDSSETGEVSYDELYASVLDLYRPIALNGDTSAVPGDLSSDEAYATSTIFCLLYTSRCV